MSDERRWLTVALEHGAKIYKLPYAPKLWVVLDQPGTYLWDAYFNTAEAAARAFCDHHRISWPETAAPDHIRRAAELLEKL